MEFDLCYEFTNHMLERLVGPVFSRIANTLIDAFIDQGSCNVHEELTRAIDAPAVVAALLPGAAMGREGDAPPR